MKTYLNVYNKINNSNSIIGDPKQIVRWRCCTSDKEAICFALSDACTKRVSEYKVSIFCLCENGECNLIYEDVV